MKYGFSALALLVSLYLSAASPDKALLDAARQAFPDNDAIILSKNEHLTINVVDGELKITKTVDMKIYFATDKAEFYRKYSIYHSFFSSISPVEAEVLTPVNGKYKEIKVDHFTTEDNVSANVFYDDLKEVSFNFPGVAAGAVGHVSYSETLKDPHFIPSYYFVSYMPIMDQDYSVTCPSSVKFNYKLFNCDSARVVFSKEEKGKFTTYHWHAKNAKNMKSEEDAPGYAYYAPHMLLTVSQYEKNGVVEKVIPDLKGLCEWYSTFVKSINKDNDSTLSSVVKSLIKDAKTDEDKIRSIYYWVQNNITYIAFEDGMNGFVPREARDVCQRRYGDCKDLTSILVSMLRQAGIDAHYTWIGSRKLPYKYSDIASSNIDNHMICIADAGGKRYVLDGTGQFTPLGFVTGFIQGKESLILKSDGNCEVYQIPVMPMERTVLNDTITVKFNDKTTLSGSISESITGYYKINQSYSYHYTRPDKRDEKFEDHLQIGNNKCKISNVGYSGFNGQDSIGRIWSDFSLPDYIKNIGEKIYFNPNLQKTGQNDKVDMTDRKLPFEVEFRGVKRTVTIIHIPDGYEIGYKPENTAFKGSKMNFSVSYEVHDRTIIESTYIDTDFLMLSLAEIAEWNNMIDAMNAAYKENIVFKKK